MYGERNLSIAIATCTMHISRTMAQKTGAKCDSWGVICVGMSICACNLYAILI